jgi:hypothetical protein
MKESLFIFACFIFSGCAKDIDRTVGKLDICPVHQVKMERRRVEIQYGYVQPSLSYVKLWSPIWADYAKSEPSLFPFGQTGTHIATERNWRSPKFAIMYVCPVCGQEAVKWWQVHKPNQSTDPTPVSVTPVAEQPPRPFATMGVLEMNAALDRIMSQDYPAILQSWLNAGRVEHDLTKQLTISDHLGWRMRIKSPSKSFLNQLKEFICDKSNSALERDSLIAALATAQTKETTEILIEVASSANDDVMRGAIGHISTLGTNLGGADREELAPQLEQLWRRSQGRVMLMSVAMAMAQVGAPSSIKLLSAAALAPKSGDSVHGHAAVYALYSANILNDHAVPPLAALLSNEAPSSAASKLASGTLSRMITRSAARALLEWLERADAKAADLARDYSTQTQFPEIWQTALDSRVEFSSEENRSAIREGLAAFKAGRTSHF